MSRLGALCFLYHRIGSYIPALGSGIQVYFMNTNDQCTTLQLSCFFAPEGFNGNPAAGQLVHIWFCWAWRVAINQAWLHSGHLTATPSLLQVKGMWSTVWSRSLVRASVSEGMRNFNYKRHVCESVFCESDI